MSKSKMTIEQAIKHYEALQKRYIKTHNGKACEVTVAALEALKEKQEREKGCEYCVDLSKYKGFEYAVLFNQTAADVVDEVKVDVECCPHCGRKLGGDT